MGTEGREAIEATSVWMGVILEANVSQSSMIGTRRGAVWVWGELVGGSLAGLGDGGVTGMRAGEMLLAEVGGGKEGFRSWAT